MSTPIELFVGDLAHDIDDQRLFDAFRKFPSLVQARVLWDPITGRSRGYGFVVFEQQQDADAALVDMDGAWIGQRVVRVCPANRRGDLPEGNITDPIDPLDWDAVDQDTLQETLARAPIPNHDVVYIGNLVFNMDEQDLVKALAAYAVPFQKVQLHGDRGYAYVQANSALDAANIIVTLHGHAILGRPVKCAWGKENAFEPWPIASRRDSAASSQHPGVITMPPYTTTMPAPFVWSYASTPVALSPPTSFFPHGPVVTPPAIPFMPYVMQSTTSPGAQYFGFNTAQTMPAFSPVAPSIPSSMTYEAASSVGSGIGAVNDSALGYFDSVHYIKPQLTPLQQAILSGQTDGCPIPFTLSPMMPVVVSASETTPIPPAHSQESLLSSVESPVVVNESESHQA